MLSARKPNSCFHEAQARGLDREHPFGVVLGSLGRGVLGRAANEHSAQLVGVYHLRCVDDPARLEGAEWLLRFPGVAVVALGLLVGLQAWNVLLIRCAIFPGHLNGVAAHPQVGSYSTERIP